MNSIGSIAPLNVAGLARTGTDLPLPKIGMPQATPGTAPSQGFGQMLEGLVGTVESKTSESQAREEKRRQLVKLLAEIERRINEENARPKKRYISPATREEVYAVYYDQLRRKIEDRGTENFPEIAGQKLYGELTMIMTVNHDGRILSTDVVEPSGNVALDRRAQIIARSAGPFTRFNDAMRQKADQIVVVSRFRFTRDETLQTNLTSR